MGMIYRKSLKGIDELAFKTNGLPMRLMSYLMVVDGESSIEHLMAKNPQLPSMDVVLQGLVQQGFVEVAGNDANVVQMNNTRVGNGAPMPSAPPAYAPPAYAPTYAPAPMQQPMSSGTNNSYSPELEQIKASMVKDVSGILGTDAGPVIQKIQAARTKDDLFGSMMGIKKIITIYANAALAEKFALRYQSLI